MSATFQRHLFLAFCVCAGWSASLHAQVPLTNAPPVPALESPVAIFRAILAMTPAEREQRFFTNQPPEKRALLLNKIREYEAMPPQVREETLVATELHWYLRQLVKMSPTNRAGLLTQVPASCRKMVSDRLQVWDILPPPLQQEALAHETTRDFVLAAPRPARADVPREIIPPPLRQEFDRLDALPPEQRQQRYANFQIFFDLTPEEKQTVLDTLPAAERRQVEANLAGLEQIPRAQRRQGLQTLRQLAGLTEEQRNEFFRSASRWKQLSPAEQQTWLKLIPHLPPLPPGAGLPPMPPQALPPDGVPLATNLRR